MSQEKKEEKSQLRNRYEISVKKNSNQRALYFMCHHILLSFLQSDCIYDKRYSPNKIEILFARSGILPLDCRQFTDQ